MYLFYIFIFPFIYIFLKIVIYFIIKKYGKISYQNFSAFGFKYHSKKDLFYADKNAWQKNFGYTRKYDVYAPLFSMIIDTEPVRFYYNNKNYLLSFWKGQYGMTTGAEIGLYQTSEQKVNKNTLYMQVSDKEMLDMSFKLYKKDELIASVKSHHWWLAIFKLGMFTKPKHLTMHISITFPNKEMLEAFLSSFKKLKYKEHDYQVENCTFSFIFKKAHTKKVWTRCLLFDAITQHFNRKKCELYQSLLSDAVKKDSNNEKSIKVQEFIPEIFKNKETVKTLEQRDNLVLFIDKKYYEKTK